jgi:hypothetical protein
MWNGIDVTTPLADGGAVRADENRGGGEVMIGDVRTDDARADESMADAVSTVAEIATRQEWPRKSAVEHERPVSPRG